MQISNSDILRSLAREANAMKNGFSEEPKGKAKRNASSVEWVLSLCEYPDFIVTKTTPKAKKHLVVMPSAKAVFIKSEEKDGEKSELLNADSYSKFTVGMPDIKLPENFWGKKLEKGKTAGERLIEIFQNHDLLDGICKKAFPENEDFLQIKANRYDSNPEDYYMEAYKAYPKLLVEYRNKSKSYELLRSEVLFCKSIIKMFGLENMRDFLNTYEESLVDYSFDSYNVRRRCAMLEASTRCICEFETPAANDERYNMSIIPRMTMKYATFRDYVLYSAVRMGYALDGRNFFTEWRDTLSMQWLIYGKLTEKYPADLPLLHSQLSYKALCMKQEIDEKKFELNVKKAAAYEGTYKDYVFIAPHCKQDFYDEATSQSNCLAGYISSFTEGRCIILFMRKKDTPDDSYITVEIIDGDVSQAKLAMNRNPHDKDLDVLYSWVQLCNSKIERSKSGNVA